MLQQYYTVSLGDDFEWKFDENESQYIDEIDFAVSCSATVTHEF